MLGAIHKCANLVDDHPGKLENIEKKDSLHIGVDTAEIRPSEVSSYIRYVLV